MKHFYLNLVRVCGQGYDDNGSNVSDRFNGVQT